MCDYAFAKHEQLAEKIDIYLGNCESIVPAIHAKFDAIICDPPYGVNYKHGGAFKNSIIPINTKLIYGDDKPFDPKHILDAMGRLSSLDSYDKPCGMMGVNHFAQHIPQSSGTWFCWDKSCNMGPKASFCDAEFGWLNRKCPRNVFHHLWLGTIRAGQGSSELCIRKHPSQKPVELIMWMIEQLRIGLGKVVLDPYMGSGSTGVAAIQKGCGFVGIEIDEEYYEIAKGRILKEIRKQGIPETNLSFPPPSTQEILV